MFIVTDLASLNVDLQISNSFKVGMSNIEYKTQSNIQIFDLIYIYRISN